MLRRTLLIRDQRARYMRSFLGLCLPQKPTFTCVHSVQSDLELCLLQKPIYMYVEANIIDSGSECTIYAVFLGLRPPQMPVFNYVYAIHKNILFNSHSLYMPSQVFLYFGPVALYTLNKLFEYLN